ncbi:hypothetical protein CL619_01085 [archaeon]|nr:hypothetical protein [archaeon]|tara:strand:+ start:2349 stop:3320 length:972 start_codon:yes stop_codon:yes gene_type:complete
MKKIVVLGGGTGSFTVLRGLKRHEVELSAIVSMADDGGSTGVLRDELGVLPPGDVRQCLVALSDSSRLMRSLMSYRFEEGCLKGHSFGNLLLCAMEKVTGSFEKAVEEVGKVLKINGKVIPVTTTDVRLRMELSDGSMLNGEGQIYGSEKISQGYKRIFLEPTPSPHNQAISEIMAADLIVFGPGGLYSSLIPLLLVPGIVGALKETMAEKVFVMNLMNRKGQTDSFKASSYLRELSKFMPSDLFDHILINNGLPANTLVEAYAKESSLVENDLIKDSHVIATDLLSEKLKEVQNGDLLKRNLIRHDHKKIAEELIKVLDGVE